MVAPHSPQTPTAFRRSLLSRQPTGEYPLRSRLGIFKGYNMPFGLTIGTDRATALQKSIQDELTKREYSAEAGELLTKYMPPSMTLTISIDPVMAEYITIMIINNKTAGGYKSSLQLGIQV